MAIANVVTEITKHGVTAALAAAILGVKPRLLLHFAEKGYWKPSIFDKHARGGKHRWSLSDLYILRLVLLAVDQIPDGREDLKEIVRAARNRGYPEGNRPVSLGGVHFHGWTQPKARDCDCPGDYALDIEYRINPKVLREDVHKGIEAAAKTLSRPVKSLRRGKRTGRISRA